MPLYAIRVKLRSGRSTPTTTTTGQTATVYNFHVEDLHSYHAQSGDHCVLVHNTCGDYTVLGKSRGLERRAEQICERHLMNDPNWMN